MLSMIKIAWRNTRRQFRRSALLGGAIAFGVLIITLLNAFTAGVVVNMKQNLSYVVGGHLFVSGSELTETGREIGTIADGAVLEDVVAGSGLPIQSIHRRSRAFATMIFGSRQASELIDGVDFEEETDLVKGLPLRAGNVETMSDVDRPIILTGLTAQKLGVEVGETVLARLTTVTGQLNVGEFTVVGVIEDSTSLGMSSAYASLPHLNSLIDLGASQYQLLSLVFDDMRAIDAAAETIYEAGVAAGLNMERPLVDVSTQGTQTQVDIGGLFGQGSGAKVQEPWEGTKYQLSTLNELMEPVQAAFSVLDSIALGIFVVLLLITMVGIMNTFRMILIERTREIGTMRAFGMHRRMVRRIFLWEAAFISLGGGVVGIGLAGLIAAVVSRLSVAHLPELQFFTANGHFTFQLTVGALVTNIVILLAMSLLAALFPANAAAKMEPAKALGAHF